LRTPTASSLFPYTTLFRSRIETGRVETPSRHSGGSTMTSAVTRILARALEGEDISWQEALQLCETSGPEFQATVAAADELRRRQDRKSTRLNSSHVSISYA